MCGAPNVPGAGRQGRLGAAGRDAAGRPQAGTQARSAACRRPACSAARSSSGISEAGDGILILSPDAPVGRRSGRATSACSTRCSRSTSRPNRPDALSHVGIAREVAALFGTPLAAAAARRAPRGRRCRTGAASTSRSATPTACPRYIARIDHRPARSGRARCAMRVRLAACGVRAISNLVDVTNYVMLETGHPLHAFDLDKLRGGIAGPARQPRRAHDDARRRRAPAAGGRHRDRRRAAAPIALAGVMGGADSEVSATTTRGAARDGDLRPRAVRRTAKRLGLHTEASHRFERGVDADGIPHASRAGGRDAGARSAAARSRARASIATRSSSEPRAGDAVVRGPRRGWPASRSRSPQAAEKLAAIGIASAPDGADAARRHRADASAPTSRSRRISIEEVMRLVGYDRAPARLPRAQRRAGAQPRGARRSRARRAGGAGPARDRRAGASCRAAGWRRWASARSPTGVVVKNPISADYEVMRTSLLPGAASTPPRRNLARGVADVGAVRGRPGRPARGRRQGGARRADATRRRSWSAGAPAGSSRASRSTSSTPSASPSSCCAALGVDGAALRAAGASAGAAAPGRRRRDSRRRRRRPPIGQRRRGPPARRARAGPRRRARSTSRSMLDAVAGARQPVRSVPPPRFPAVTRDISFWIDVGVTADEQRALLASAARAAAARAGRARGLPRSRATRPPGKKGMLWTLTYRADDRTLTDAEVDAAHARVVAALKAAPSVVHSLERRRRSAGCRLSSLTAKGVFCDIEVGHDEGRHRRERLREGRRVLEEGGRRDRRDRVRHDQGDARARARRSRSPASATSSCATRTRARAATRRPARRSPSARAAC